MLKLTLFVIAAITMFTPTSALVASGVGIDVLREETYTYSASITTASTSLVVIPQYTRIITTYIYYPILTVEMSIPFTGNSVAGRRARIIATLSPVGGRPYSIYDGTTYSSGTWDLHPLTIVGSKANLLPGTYVLRIQAAVNGGTLYIPHFNAGLIESTLSPKLFARIVIKGYK